MPARSISPLRLFLLATALLGHCLVVWAEEGPFKVEIKVAEEFRPLLLESLQIVQAIKDERLTQRRFEFLAQHAVDEVRDILATEGYFSPEIVDRIQALGGTTLLELDVQPGQATRVGRLELDIQRAEGENAKAWEERVARLRKEWPLPAGAIFRNEQWVAGKAQILKALQKADYPVARIRDSRVDVDAVAHSAAITLVIETGPEVRFGEIEISGMERLPATIVTRLNRIRPGDAYSEQAIEDLQNRLQQTGYFSSVFVSAPCSPDAPAVAPIRVQVTENTAQKLGIGAGYSTDKGLGVEWRHEDSLTFVPGWRSSSRLKLEELEQSLNGDLMLVPLKGGFQPVLSAEVKRSDIQNDETVTARVIGQLRRHSLNETLSLAVDVHYELHPGSLQRSSGVTAIPINLSWTRRAVDDLLFPRQGYIVNLQGGGAFDKALSDTPFVRLYGRGNFYQPVGSRGTLLLRTELGGVMADRREGIPSDYLFRSGGSQSVRGYEFGKLGVPEADAIVPGRFLGVASVEYSHPIVADWLGAIFVDAGNVVDRLQDFKAKLGYGAGLRWKSPLGPLNLDVAFGDADKSWRLHLSVGSLF